MTDEMEDEADAICSDVFDNFDAFLFHKVCELYVQFTKILNETDFDNEQIVLNADWWHTQNTQQQITGDLKWMTTFYHSSSKDFQMQEILMQIGLQETAITSL